MNNNRQYRSHQPAQRLDPRQAAQATRTTRQDYGQSDVFVDEDEIYDDPPPGRLPTSSRRYHQPLPGQGKQVRYEFQPEVVHTNIPPRRSAQAAAGQKARDTEEPQALRPKRKRRGWHPLWYLGLGMIVMLVLWVGLSWLMNWWYTTQNDMTYTKAFRTFSVDYAVGHNNDSSANPSHFIVQNDKRHIIILELPADDASKTVIYTGPQLIGDGQERTPVTISFSLNAQTGRYDMVLHVQDQTYVFTNNGKKFVPPQQ